MKLITSAAVFLAVLTAGAFAAIPAGRGELSASVDATATHDSNVFGTPDAVADWSGLLVPRVSYVRKAGRIEANATAGISFIRYAEQTQLNADNLDASATLQVTESDFRNYSGLLSAAYRETSELNPDLDARVNLKTTVITARSALITGPRSNAAISGTYTDTRLTSGSDQQVLNTEALYDYKDFFYGNSLRLVGSYDELHSSGNNTLGVPLKQNSYVLSAGLGRALYHNTLRAGISYGYRVLNRSAAEVLATGGPRQRSGYVVGVSLEGPFLPVRYFPRVTSLFSLVYQDAATPGIYDTGTKEVTGRLSLLWQAREGTGVSFSVHRIQRLAVNDLSVVTTTMLLSVEQALRLNLTGTLSAGYDWSTYRSINRQDETTRLTAELRYHLAKSWDVHLTSIYTSTSSTLPLSNYHRLVTSLSLTREF
jgi:hypothetical protein